MSEERFPYELVSHWRVPGDIDDVFIALTDGEAAMRWWPEAYRDLREVSPGDADGRGWIVDVVSRGALPYDLKWRLEIIEAVRPTLIRLKASGDMVGFGEWRIAQSGEYVDLAYTWRIGVGKAWMQRFEFLLKPFFKLNHDWVMRRGEAGLRREVDRRTNGAALPDPASP